MATGTTTSPADAALRKAAALLREQLLLPHVRLDDGAEASQRRAPETTGAARLEKTIWGSPAGKKQLSPRLVKLIPAHKTYVEPFAGSGAVFFAKPPSDQEVLSDADPEIAFAYKALSQLTDAELATLKKKDWTGRRTLFEGMRKAAPRGKIDKLYRFLYLSHFAYGKLRGKSYNPNAEGIAARTIDRIEKYRDRLKNLTVRSGHYADVVKEFDGKDTFFFLDPPYPGHNVQVGEDRFDEVEFRKVLDSIKGKFLVTYGTRGKLDTSGFRVRMIRTRRSIASMRGVGGPKTLPQLLIANYAITEKSLGPYRLDVVEAAIDLSYDAAADLDLACVLAKALADVAERPAVSALAEELRRFADLSGAGQAVLARELRPLGERLAHTVGSDLPDLVDAMNEALIDLDEIAPPVPPTSAPASSSSAATGLALKPLEKRIRLLKTDEERYVLGIVLEPETVDAQDDIYSATEVRDAAHRFMEQYRNIGLMHRGLVNEQVKILESYLAPAAFSLDGTQVQKGTWLLAVRVLDDELWGQIQGGALTGLSIGGSARREAAQ